MFVKFPLKKTVLYYAGLVQKTFGSFEYTVKFLRYKKGKFSFPDVDDISTVS